MQWLNSLHLAYPRVAKSTMCLAVVVPGVAATLAGIRRAIKLEQDTAGQMQKAKGSKITSTPCYHEICMPIETIRHTLPNRCPAAGMS